MIPPINLREAPEGVLLDLGSVRETAEVTINGKAAGVAWMRPYRLDITRPVRSGVNRLRIDVTNLLINKVLGEDPSTTPRYIPNTAIAFPPATSGPWFAIPSARDCSAP
ncbi:MAG TPA: hypothetical protein VM120_22990 [Bryobacteraceae bacterium]|nr:hypothetical protein [Bryobacteraceae bacterium]